MPDNDTTTQQDRALSEEPWTTDWLIAERERLTRDLEAAQRENIEHIGKSNRKILELTSERDDARARLAEAEQVVEAAQAIALRPLKTHDALRQALARFGRHHLTCSTFKDGPHQASPETDCDCGLTTAFDAATVGQASET